MSFYSPCVNQENSNSYANHDNPTYLFHERNLSYQKDNTESSNDSFKKIPWLYSEYSFSLQNIFGYDSSSHITEFAHIFVLSNSHAQNSATKSMLIVYYTIRSTIFQYKKRRHIMYRLYRVNRRKCCFRKYQLYPLRELLKSYLCKE